MFTGLVQMLGVVSDVRRVENGMDIVISVPDTGDLKVGDSMLTNGVCLTATEVYDTGFVVHAVSETLSRTTLGSLKRGDKVNLERALSPGDRLDGHIVTGHIDGVGRIEKRIRAGTAVNFWFSASKDITRLIVEKGSIAVDGISLTVTGVTDTAFGVSIIPHTLENTTLGFKYPGDLVNLETDIIGKYVVKLLEAYNKSSSNRMGLEFLAEHGFL